MTILLKLLGGELTITPAQHVAHPAAGVNFVVSPVAVAGAAETPVAARVLVPCVWK